MEWCVQRKLRKNNKLEIRKSKKYREYFETPSVFLMQQTINAPIHLDIIHPKEAIFEDWIEDWVEEIEDICIIFILLYIIWQGTLDSATVETLN